MELARYGDMEAFMEERKAEGYEDVRLVSTTNGEFMTASEAKVMFLRGSTLLLGRR